MKKQVSRFIVLLLICTVFSLVTLPASATEIHESAPIGNDVSSVARAQSSGLPFTFSPDQDVLNLWTTNRDGGYNFVPGRVEGTTIHITGSFEHSLPYGDARASVCYPSGSSYVAAISSEVAVGQRFNGSGLKELLDDSRTYYGGLKSTSGGYVTSALVTISAS